MQETEEMWVQSLGREDPLEEEMAPHSSILSWKSPWAEDPGGLQSMGVQRVKHNWAHAHKEEKKRPKKSQQRYLSVGLWIQVKWTGWIPFW